MKAHHVTMLGTGLIGDFYTATLHGQRGRDHVQVVFSRSEERSRAFAERWSIPEHTTDLDAAIRWFDSNDVPYVKRPEQGKMKDVAFIKDPDGYWIEIVEPARLMKLGR